jgi:GT2 family glycosyltransferase
VSPRFSIVIAVYNAAASIGETLESALSQDPPADELIVADDGSTDRIEEALAPFASRVELLRLPHAGVAAARNVACRAANGDFVLFLDADDLLLPGKLAALHRLVRAGPELDILGTDLYFERDGCRAGRFTDANTFPPPERQRRTILERCYIAQATIRRSRLLELGGFDESLRSGSDWDCLLRLILAGSRAGFAEEPLAVYRIRGGSLTSLRTETFRDRARILEKALADPALRPQERPLAEEMLASQRARAVLADAQAAIAANRPDVRRRCFELAATSGCSPRDRAWGLAVLASPRVLRPWLGRHFDATSELTRRLPATGSQP